jgi:hypothetical protein
LPGFIKVFPNGGVVAVACHYLLNNLLFILKSTTPLTSS